ncbi:T9SS type A sorting domain-containing protein [Hymenobacter armeniacus]|uniref:T9SS type A sorting domain-containing protein n=1 Tax=Hymenobacter armeniacus TaxID=2771358 RepID=A0ABR8JWT3_9BACT|nr:T9SS type A sorting domain-containing protein [Hymenobacter armeniacus]MBD2724425.1 T9SS type A sorting domain-containing protein [Hymenobacter armeniacus]
MLTTLQTRLKTASRWLPVALLPLLPLAASAQQLGYSPTSATNVAGTYTDLGTNGTAITTSSTDDANSAAQNIGFTFTYNGTAFTQFVLNTNGLIRLGSAAPSVANLFGVYETGQTAPGVDPVGSTNAADVNLIMPFNFDLIPGTGTAEYRVATTGTAPNRVCTIQWKNVSDKSGTARLSQYANMSFQAKLYETTNNIEFVYGPTTASTNTAISRFPSVGIKGSGSGNGQTVLANKTTGAAAWSTTAFITGVYTGTTHNFNATALPDAGRTYRFAPGTITPPANDDCAGAIALTVGTSCTNVTANNSLATASAGVPAPGATCFGTTPPTVGNDVWYTVVVPATGTVTITTSAATGSPVTDTGLLIYSGTCSALTEIGCNDAISTTNEFSSATVTGRTPGSTLYVRAFTYPGTDAGAFGICATTVAPNDASVRMVYALTKLPIPQGAPHTVSAYVTNTGTSAQTNLVVTLNVTGANTFTNTQTVASLAAGASTTVTFAPYVPTATGNNTVTVTVPADDNTGNNASSVTQVVNTSDYSYNDGTQPTSARGFGPSTTFTGAFLTKFTANTSVNVTQVRAFLVNFAGAPSPTIGKTVYAVVMNPTTGAVLGRSPDYVVTAADVAGTGYTNFTLSTPVALAAGDFLVGLAQTYQTGQTAQYFPLGTQPEVYTRAGQYFTSSATTAAAPVDVTTVANATRDFRFMLEAVTTSTSAPACTPVNNLAAGSITQTGATITFTAPAGTGGYVVTYTAAGGTPVTVTPAPTGSPITLTGLASGTTYTVSVVTSCSTGANSIPVTTTFTTLLPPATYATLPVNEGFEGTWISVGGTRDVPTNSWRNTPATGDNSWRREDDGFASANWQYQSYETPSTSNPTPPYVTRSSTGAHSARFHTFGSPIGSQGKFDLYANLSGTAGARTLTFDFINPSGTDKVDVFYSTDGGATFTTTPLLTATTNTAFTAKTVVIPSTSATTVIRFQATSDFGQDDMGIDNVRLSIISSSRNEALAATVGLYPNPAHQNFTLDVPAGSLHAATATLINSLGQTVLTQQLSLPTAGGSTKFDVSRLAAGVYSLQLKSGNDLVVKRVVVE